MAVAVSNSRARRLRDAVVKRRLFEKPNLFDSDAETITQTLHKISQKLDVLEKTVVENVHSIFGHWWHVDANKYEPYASLDPFGSYVSAAYLHPPCWDPSNQELRAYDGVAGSSMAEECQLGNPDDVLQALKGELASSNVKSSQYSNTLSHMRHDDIHLNPEAQYPSDHTLLVKNVVGMGSVDGNSLPGADVEKFFSLLPSVATWLLALPMLESSCGTCSHHYRDGNATPNMPSELDDSDKGQVAIWDNSEISSKMAQQVFRECHDAESPANR